jgi:hypothetical protein
MHEGKKWSGLVLMVVLLAALLTGCGSAQETATATVAPAEPTTAAPAATATTRALPDPTATTAATEVAAVDQCVVCHTDKDQLIATAKIEEEVIKESEGAG